MTDKDSSSSQPGYETRRDAPSPSPTAGTTPSVPVTSITGAQESSRPEFEERVEVRFILVHPQPIMHVVPTQPPADETAPAAQAAPVVQPPIATGGTTVEVPCTPVGQLAPPEK